MGCEVREIGMQFAPEGSRQTLQPDFSDTPPTHSATVCILDENYTAPFGRVPVKSRNGRGIEGVGEIARIAREAQLSSFIISTLATVGA